MDEVGDSQLLFFRDFPLTINCSDLLQNNSMWEVGVGEEPQMP